MRYLAPSLSLCCALLAGCDALGIESAAQVAERKQAEAHAIGSACRHAVRSVEDCFKTHPKAGKAAIFAGWKEMDQYMRDNQIVGMPSPVEAVPAAEIGEDTANGDHPAEGEAKATASPKATAKPGPHSGTDAKTHKS